MSESGGPEAIITLPKGGGAMKGLGETFAPDLHTGTGNFTVPIALPPGRNGFQPHLSLTYSTGNGNGLFGLGWSLAVPGITRKTSKGIPRYRDQNPAARDRDTFILSGAEDLVFIGQVTDENGVRADSYRPRTEGLFAEIHRYRSNAPQADYWRVRTKDGLVTYYGTNPVASERPAYPPGTAATGDPATIRKPERPTDVFAWAVTLTKDPFGNRIEYLYGTDEGEANRHRWKQPLLKQIRYADYGDRDEPAFLISANFDYETRPDAFSDYRAAFEIRTTQRCRTIEIATHADRNRKMRRYELTYRSAALNLMSLLQSVQVVGFDDEGVESRELPPLEFEYTDFDPANVARRDFYPLQGFALPGSSLANASIDFVDLFGNGLPDILEMSGAVRYWRNRGAGRFGVPDAMVDAPPQRLADAGVQLVDANGDGRTDLLVTHGPLSGYYPLQFGGLWDRRSFQKYAVAPTFDLQDPEVRLADLTGDGVTDVIRSGTRLECFFNDARDGWRPTDVQWVERRPLDEFPNVNFSDPRVKWADMSGDEMQDIALIHDGNVEYWPNLGYGQWGRRLHMANSPRFPSGYDARRILIGDVNGDGLADIVYVDDRRVHVWINRSGSSWSDVVVIPGTPPVSSIDSTRLIDLLGSGISGVLWSKDARDAAEDHYFFLDLTGGTKPGVLSAMVNNMGAVTKVGYVPSTQFYLDDEASAETKWKTPLPFPVQVVSRVEVIDELSGGKLSTEYRYHHGYWDGVEREFRGFGMVEQRDTESFDSFHRPGLHGEATPFAPVDRQFFSPPTLTKTWFHLGAVGDDATNWQEVDWKDEFWQNDPQQLRHVDSTNDFLTELRQRNQALTSRDRRRILRDALRSLRGSVIRTELYGLDGTAREDRPYTVTEYAYGLREEAVPAAGSDRPRIFFPHLVAQRSTQWERGDDPLTNLSYARDYDPYGTPLTDIKMACPRGWRAPVDAVRDASYLATISQTQMASSGSADVYMHDRVARAVTYEILNPPPADIDPAAPGRTIADIVTLAGDADNRRVVFDEISFYDADPMAPDNGAFVGLPFGALGRYGVVTRSESLVLTTGILNEAYATLPPYLQPGQPFAASAEYPAAFVQQMKPLAGYVFHAAGAPYAGGYYVETVRRRCDFHRGATTRGLIAEQLDPLGAPTLIGYDQPYQLLPVAAIDGANLRIEAIHNYRMLLPQVLIDANGNRTEVRFSPVGLVTESWVKGKENADEGDVDRPSARLEYDFLAFRTSKRIDPTRPRPIYLRTLRYAHHDSDPDNRDETIEAREYSDGFGRLLQTRVQGEAVRFGDAIFGGGSTVLPARQADGAGGDVVGTENVDVVNPNVIVTAWQRYDNKGRVVEQYEPYLSTGWTYAPPRDDDPATRELGARTVTIYDPRGQIVRTVNSDRSEQRVIYGIPDDIADPIDPNRVTPTPWEAYTYDANDNAGRTHAATTAAYRHHWNTPTTILIDALGRAIAATGRTRAAPATAPGPVPPIEEYDTRSEYDIRGNLQRVTDRLNRPAFVFTYDLANRAVRVISLDAGVRTHAYDAIGQEIERVDGKGARLLRSYDGLNRASRVWARNDAAQAMTLRGDVSYGDGGVANQPANERSAARRNNQLGRPLRYHDEAGEMASPAYDFKGNLIEKQRSVIADAPIIAALNAAGGAARTYTVDWEDPPTLDDPYETSITYDALNRVKSIRYPRAVGGARHVLVPRYNNAGALERVALDDEVFVERIAYNARGQRILISYGNGLMTRYAYDPETFNLLRMRTDAFLQPAPRQYVRQGTPLQDFGYAYDLAGNVLSITERTSGCGVRNNPESLLFPELTALLGAGDALVRQFTYDPFYRLTSATGREAIGIPTTARPWEDVLRDGWNWGGVGTPSPASARDVTRIYTERYTYDAADNLVTLQHGTWTRHFGMSGFTPQAWAQEWPTHVDRATPWTSPTTNRLTHVGDDQPAVPQTHFFDGGGNLVRENTERRFAWDVSDRMIGFAVRTAGGTASVEACYLYDATGRRVKKLVRKNGSVDVTVYIDDIFEHRISGGKQNYTLHVMDDRSRLALVRIGLPLQDEAGPNVQYQIADHLGSAQIIVGGDDAGADVFVNREELFPYGETSFGSFGRKRYRFTGKERDEESGLNYHGARFYLPWVARWASCDPEGVRVSLNAYKYAAATPLTAIDLDGLKPSRADAGTAQKTGRDGGSASSADAGRPDGGTSADAGTPLSNEEQRRSSLLLYETKKEGSAETRNLAKEPMTGVWGHTALVTDLDDAIKQTKDQAAATGKLSALGILVHGDKAGSFTIGGQTFDPNNVPLDKIKALADYLTPDARVYLLGCISAADQDGSILLKQLSEALPGRSIIGMNTLNDLEMVHVRKVGGLFNRTAIGDPLVTAEPLDITDAMSSRTMRDKEPDKWKKGRHEANEFAPQAKVARDGKIVKWPANETAARKDARMGDTPLTGRKTSTVAPVLPPKRKR